MCITNTSERICKRRFLDLLRPGAAFTFAPSCKRQILNHIITNRLTPIKWRHNFDKLMESVHLKGLGQEIENVMYGKLEKCVRRRIREMVESGLIKETKRNGEVVYVWRDNADTFLSHDIPSVNAASILQQNTTVEAPGPMDSPPPMEPDNVKPDGKASFKQPRRKPTTRRYPIRATAITQIGGNVGNDNINRGNDYQGAQARSKTVFYINGGRSHGGSEAYDISTDDSDSDSDTNGTVLRAGADDDGQSSSDDGRGGRRSWKRDKSKSIKSPSSKPSKVQVQSKHDAEQPDNLSQATARPLDEKGARPLGPRSDLVNTFMAQPSRTSLVPPRPSSECSLSPSDSVSVVQQTRVPDQHAAARAEFRSLTPRQLCAAVDKSSEALVGLVTWRLKAMTDDTDPWLCDDLREKIEFCFEVLDVLKEVMQEKMGGDSDDYCFGGRWWWWMRLQWSEAVV